MATTATRPPSPFGTSLPAPPANAPRTSSSPPRSRLPLPAPDPAGHYLPAERSPAWRRLDAAIANHVILRGVLGLTEGQMEDIGTVWYSEDAEAAVAEGRSGRAGGALPVDPAPAP